MSEPSENPGSWTDDPRLTAPPDYAALLEAMQATAPARPRNYQLGVVGAFILAAATAALMAFPIGLACAGAWWIFTAGWNVIYG